MHPLYSGAEIRQVEREAAQRLAPGTLMQRAGQAGANAALDLLPFTTSRARVLVLAGPGNNGGDALETAAHLAHAGAQVSVLHIEGGGRSSPDREHALHRARGSAAKFEALSPQTIAAVEWSLVVDGLFGIGLARPLEGALRALVEAVNALPCRRLALDVPSGLDADTGAIVGTGTGTDGKPVALRATHTVTFIGDKPGLHTCEGRDHAGMVQVARLDIDAALFPPSRQHLNDAALFRQHARSRSQNSHKGSYGSVAVLGGGAGMAGAAILAARAALLTGAGRVYACFVENAPAYDGRYPELMCRPAQDGGFDAAVAPGGAAVVVAGPGMGTSSAARALLARAIAADAPLVLDADALNLLAGDGALRDALARRNGSAQPTLLTPHPLEAARLLGVPVAEVQADRLAAARILAARLQAVVVLKGSGTVLASPQGDIVVNTTGNPALATGGTGDVLAGLCGSLLAQGWPLWEGALAAVWLHGMAADVLAADCMGTIGITAGELIPAIRTALNRMVQQQGR